MNAKPRSITKVLNAMLCVIPADKWTLVPQLDSLGRSVGSTPPEAMCSLWHRATQAVLAGITQPPNEQQPWEIEALKVWMGETDG